MGNKEAELSSRQEAEINPILKAKLDKRKEIEKSFLEENKSHERIKYIKLNI